MEDAYYDVERILDKRRNRSNGRPEYLIKWEGYEETTWEPETNLETIPHMLLEFEKNFKKVKKQKAKEVKRQRITQQKKLQQLDHLKKSLQAKRASQKPEATSTNLASTLTNPKTRNSRLSSPTSKTPSKKQLDVEPRLPKKRTLKKLVDVQPQKQPVSRPKPLPQTSPSQSKAPPAVSKASLGSKEDLVRTERPSQDELLTHRKPPQALPNKEGSAAESFKPVEKPEEPENPTADEALPVTECLQEAGTADLPDLRLPKFCLSLDQVALTAPSLKTDKVAKIIGAKRRDDSIYYAVLFKMRRDGTLPTVGVYDHSTLKKYKFEGLSEYLLDSMVI